MLDLKSKPKSKFLKINVLIDQQTDDKLTDLAYTFRTSKAEIIRYAIKEVLPKLEEEAKKVSEGKS